MHGAGNDFVVLDAREGALQAGAALARFLADRHTGIGCDQVVTLEASAHADVFMRIHNADGSEAGACGNATRCVAKMLGAGSAAAPLRIETVSGLLTAWEEADHFVADMGAPAFAWDEIPLARAADTLHLGLPGDPAACSMGNPHATLFVGDIDAVPVAARGAALETDPLFPARANIGFAQILAPDRIRLRVWERGAGLTRACGSGACAALVNAVRRGLSARSADMLLDGGVLRVTWRDDGDVLMAGPAATVFHGFVSVPAPLLGGEAASR